MLGFCSKCGGVGAAIVKIKVNPDRYKGYWIERLLCMKCKELLMEWFELGG